MSWHYALLILSIVLASEANSHVVSTTTQKNEDDKDDKKDVNGEPTNSKTTNPKADSGGTTTSPVAWYDQKNVKNGLIGGAAAAGLATFAGLGISAMVQANKATTPPPLITTPWVAPTLPMTTPQLLLTTPLITTPQIRARAEEGSSSISPLFIGLLTLLALCCCLGLIAFCIFMKTRKRTTAKRRARPPPTHEEKQPLVHEPALPQPSGHYEQPMMFAPVPTPSYVPVPAVTPTATVGVDTTHDGRANMFVSGVDRNRDGIPDMLQQPMVAPSTSLYAPAMSYAPGMYGPSSVYALA